MTPGPVDLRHRGQQPRLDIVGARRRAHAAEDQEMLHAAHAAAHLWQAVGTEHHCALAQLLLAQVHALLGHPSLALSLTPMGHTSIFLGAHKRTVGTGPVPCGHGQCRQLRWARPRRICSTIKRGVEMIDAHSQTPRRKTSSLPVCGWCLDRQADETDADRLIIPAPY
jgi:hypothetical protein